jgi:hypothetical protein
VKRQLARLLIVIPAAIALAAATLAGTAAARTDRAPAGKTFVDRLYGVTTLSRSDAWAAGLMPNSSLILHWNGRAWSKSQAGAGYYLGTGADSASDVWAVGGTSWFSPSAPLIEHWNGTAWSRVPTPDVAGGPNYLNSVSATSYRNAWAVGATGFANNDATLIEHWNGTAWTVVASPTPDGDAQVMGVSATRRTDAWAVGMTRGRTCRPNCATFIEHWNGTAWTQVPSPSPAGRGLEALLSVSASGRHNAWAVGTIGYARTLQIHWNGKTWS